MKITLIFLGLIIFQHFSSCEDAKISNESAPVISRNDRI